MNLKNIFKKIIFFALTLSIFFTTTSFAKSLDSDIIDRIYIEGEGYIDVVRGEVFTNRIDGMFHISNVSSFNFTNVVSRNNFFNAVVNVQPFAFGIGITAVDIHISWPNSPNNLGLNSITFTNVGIGQTMSVHIPSNAGRYTISVRTNGPTGNVSMRVWDQFAGW